MSDYIPPSVSFIYCRSARYCCIALFSSCFYFIPFYSIFWRFYVFWCTFVFEATQNGGKCARRLKNFKSLLSRATEVAWSFAGVKYFNQPAEKRNNISTWSWFTCLNPRKLLHFGFVILKAVVVAACCQICGAQRSTAQFI